LNIREAIKKRGLKGTWVPFFLGNPERKHNTAKSRELEGLKPSIRRFERNLGYFLFKKKPRQKLSANIF